MEGDARSAGSGDKSQHSYRATQLLLDEVITRLRDSAAAPARTILA
ncbi:MAG: hypothetical protein R2856_18000 [Caldilineaceae bacterium]